MPFKYQPTQPVEPYDPILSRDIRIGINPARATTDIGRIPEIGTELSYDPVRDSGDVAGSPDLLSFGASLPLRGVGMLAEGVGSTIAGISDTINTFGPAKAYGETVGKAVGGIGGTILDWIGGPGRFVQDIGATIRLSLTKKEDLPADIQALMRQDGDNARVVEYMRETGRSFSDDRALNLAASLLLDPLNLTPFIAGKVALLPAALKVAGVGAGAAAGAGAGTIGLAAGAAAGYKGAATIISKLPRSLRAGVGFDLSRKIRLVQAMQATGRPLGSLGKYKYIADLHAGLFDKVAGVSDAIKGAFAVKIAEAAPKAFGSDLYDTIEKTAAGPFARGTERVVVRRLGLASQGAALSTARDMALSNISDTAAAATEQLVSDTMEAARSIRNGEFEGTVQQVLVNNANEAGRSLGELYGTNEIDLAYEVEQILSTAGKKNLDGVFDPTAGDLQVWKARRVNRLRAGEIQSKNLGEVDWQKEATTTLQSHGDEMTKRLTGMLVGQSTDEAATIGAINAQRFVFQDMVGLADEFANAGSDGIRSYVNRAAATGAQIDHVVGTWLGGATVREGRIIGGKYFNETGMLTANPKLQAELARKVAAARHIRYGFVINRAGNVRRVFNVAAGFEGMNEARRAAARKEVTRLMGRPVTDEQMLALARGGRSSRITILRGDSLIDTEVSKWAQAHEMLKRMDVTAEEIGALNLPAEFTGEISTILRKGANEDTAAAISKRHAVWGRHAGLQFADVRNLEYASAGGAAAPSQIRGLLESAMQNDAAFTAAKEADLAQLRQLWQAAGGNADDIDALDKSVRAAGYRLGIAPESGIINVPSTMSVRDAAGQIKRVTMNVATPYVDITSDFIDGFRDLANKPVVGFFGGTLRRMFAPVYQSEITGRARQKMISSLAPYMTPDEIVLFDSKINELAAEQRIGVRGLVSAFNGKSDIYNAADAAIRELSNGDDLARRIATAVRDGNPRLDIDTAVLRAYAGDVSTSGVTQWITGQIKANGLPGIGAGKAIAKLTENFYPTLKYSYNPLFWAQEIIESPFFGEARGLRRAEMEESLIRAGFSKNVPDGKGGFKKVADAQAVRNMLGERGSAVARNLHEAAFGTMVASRSGIPTTLRAGLESESVVGMIRRLRSGTRSTLDDIAEFKEAHRDMMAMRETAEGWSKHIAKTQPDQFLRLTERYGTDELDQLLGYLGEHRRAVDLGWGTEALGGLTPPGYGFAVRPSSAGLGRVRASAEVFVPFSESAEGLSLLATGRPRDFLRLARINILDEARAAGYDVTRLEQRFSSLEDAARRVKQDLPSYGVENIKASDSYKVLNQEVTALKKEVVEGLGMQAVRSQTDEVIVRELYGAFSPEMTSLEKFDGVMGALAQGRRYGMKFRMLGGVVEEVFQRAGGNSLFNMSQVQAQEQIRNVVRNLMQADDTALRVQTRRVAKILNDSAIRMIEDHGAQEAMFRATAYRYQEAARQMDKVNYFNPDRGVLERTMNHQFLGLYPLSYMFGKVLPEATRFLFWRPFGAIAPGAGYQAYSKITEYLGREGFAPNFEEQGIQRPDYLFLLSQLIPGHPDDISVGVPGWLRRSISTVSRQGYDQLTAANMFGEVGKAVTDTGVLGAGKTTLTAIQELLTPPDKRKQQEDQNIITTLR